jgi:hypothetical protein
MCAPDPQANNSDAMQGNAALVKGGTIGAGRLCAADAQGKAQTSCLRAYHFVPSHVMDATSGRPTLLVLDMISSGVAFAAAEFDHLGGYAARMINPAPDSARWRK